MGGIKPGRKHSAMVEIIDGVGHGKVQEPKQDGKDCLDSLVSVLSEWNGFVFAARTN